MADAININTSDNYAKIAGITSPRVGIGATTSPALLTLKGAAATAGANNIKTVTGGSTTVTAVSGTPFTNIEAGYIITSAGQTVIVLAKASSTSITIDRKVDWYNGGSGYTFTYKCHLLEINDETTNRLRLAANGTLQLAGAARVINTITSDLQVQTGLYNGEVVELKGYYVDRDGGQGLFYWDASGSEPDNSGTIIKPLSGTNGNWKRIYEPGITHLAWFGLVSNSSGDASGNKTRIDKAMLDDAGTSGRIGVLILPAGRFYTTGGHVVPSSLNLKGQGRGEVLASGTATIQTLIIHRDNASNHICFQRIGPLGSNCSNRWFAMDFSLMAESGQTGTDSAGFQVGDMNGFVMERMMFFGYTSGKALWFYNLNQWVEDWTLQDVSFNHNKYNIYFERRSVALPAVASSSGTGNKTISCTNHGRSAWECVCLPSGPSGTFEIRYIESVTNANTFVVDDNLSNAITNVQGYYGGNNSFGFGKIRGVKIELCADGEEGFFVHGPTPQTEVFFYGIFAQVHFWLWDRDNPTTVYTKPIHANGAYAHISNSHFDISTDGMNDVIFYSVSFHVIDIISVAPAVGDVYSNNGSSFIVRRTRISGNSGTIFCDKVSGVNGPASSGTLDKVSGTGDNAVDFDASTTGDIDRCSAHTQQGCVGDTKRFGFGTVKPAVPVHIVHGEGNYGVLLKLETSGTSYDGPRLSFKHGPTAKKWALGSRDGQSVQDFAIYEDGDESAWGTNRVTLKAGGFIGMGTPNPAALVEIKGLRAPSTYAGQLLITGDGDHAILQIRTTDPGNKITGIQIVGNETLNNPEWSIYVPNGSDNLLFKATNSAAPKDVLYLKKDGSVGIATTAPVSKLEVAGSLGFKVVTKTTTYTAADEGVILANASGGAFTINLPQASTVTGRTYYIKKIDNAANVTIDGYSSETIDGSTTKILGTQYACVQIISDGSNWHIISQK